MSGAGLLLVTLAWSPRGAGLRVDAPPGEHVAPDAPVRGWLSWGPARTDWDLPGAALQRGLPVIADQGALTGALRLSLCEDAGTTCRQVEVALGGLAQGRRGRIDLVLGPPASPAAPPPSAPADHYASDPDAAFDLALSEAAARGGFALLDFGATWCPPCNLMATQVLHDPADAVALAGFHLVEIDADRPDAWTLKDRYAVGGYPTLVAVDATGRELSRVVGYDDEAALLAWLAQVRDGQHQADWSPAGTTPALAATRAWILVASEREEQARAMLARAATDPASQALPDFRRARFALDLDPQDLAWLVVHDASSPQAVLGWVFEGLSVTAFDGVDPAVVPGLRAAISGALPAATPTQAADLLYAMGQLAPEGPERQAWMAAAVRALEPALTGDLAADRGHLDWQAALLAGSGDVQGALEVLDRAAGAWPDEFTFHDAKAVVLLDAGRPADALAPARLALERSWGDNRLRAARGLAQVLVALERPDEARAVVDQALAQAARPGEGLDVRTPRYLEALEALRASLPPP